MSSSPTETESPPPKRLPVVIAAVASLLVGGAVGAFAVGPALGPAAPPAAAAEAEAAGEGGHGEEAVAALMFTLDGVIVNPAGSRGQHHLIATVAFKLTTAADEARLRGSEVALRDAVGALLEQKSLDQLTAPGIRDQLRGELKALAAPYVTTGSVTVYLPQYIVQ